MLIAAAAHRAVIGKQAQNNWLWIYLKDLLL